MCSIGQFNKLTIVKEVKFGLYLDGGAYGEILLPKRYVPAGVKSGKKLEVFLYRDSEDRIIATTEKPYGVSGDFVCLKAAAVTGVGAFMDWGLPKDLLVPFKEQKESRIEEGKSYLIKILHDEKSDRIIGSQRIEKYLNKKPASYEYNEKVDLIIASKHRGGYKVVINNCHLGKLYENEVFVPLKCGQRFKGYVKQVREDGKIDVMLQPTGYSHIKNSAELIINKLKESGGSIKVSDKSSPEKIYNLFGLSKKAYKKTAGLLYRAGKIKIEEDYISIKKK